MASSVEILNKRKDPIDSVSRLFIDLWRSGGIWNINASGVKINTDFKYYAIDRAVIPADIDSISTMRLLEFRNLGSTMVTKNMVLDTTLRIRQVMIFRIDGLYMVSWAEYDFLDVMTYSIYADHTKSDFEIGDSVIPKIIGGSDYDFMCDRTTGIGIGESKSFEGLKMILGYIRDSVI